MLMNTFRCQHRCSDPRPRVGGFTLIELLVVIAVMAVCMTLAAPSFSKMISNYRVRSGAEGILNGLNMARAEAIRRNAPVTFKLAADAGWSVYPTAASASVIQSRAAGDSEGVTAASSNSSLQVNFLPTGLVDATGTQLTQITVASSNVTTADSRKINIFGGGLIRMCDPNVSITDDPRKC